jgi:type II secretory pathway pseudopilin PulG
MRAPKWWELAIAMGLLATLAIILLPFFARARESSRRASCQNNLKQLGLVVKMYANESRGERFPPRSPIPDNWILDMHAVYPEYLTDPNVLVCPDSPAASDTAFTLKKNRRHPNATIGQFHPDCATGQFYNYTGYTLHHDAQAQALFDAYQRSTPGYVLDVDLEVALPEWGDDVDKFGGGSSNLPILWDRVPPTEEEFGHHPLGINILHLHGNVEFVRYSPYNAHANFPATYLSAHTFGSAVPLLSPDCY